MTDREKAANHMPPLSRAERLELEGGIEETNRRFERMRDAGRKTALLAGAVATATAVTAGALFGGLEREGQADESAVVDFSEAERVDGEIDLVETPDGKIYKMVWLDGATGEQWSDLNLTRDQRTEVLRDNGRDAVSSEPMTIGVNIEYLEAEETTE